MPAISGIPDVLESLVNLDCKSILTLWQLTNRKEESNLDKRFLLQDSGYVVDTGNTGDTSNTVSKTSLRRSAVLRSIFSALENETFGILTAYVQVPISLTFEPVLESDLPYICRRGQERDQEDRGQLKPQKNFWNNVFQGWIHACRITAFYSILPELSCNSTTLP